MLEPKSSLGGRVQITETELRQEWFYLYQERLGILADDGDITPAQAKLAKAEADRAVEEMREGE
jgi:hypothetical protein